MSTDKPVTHFSYQDLENESDAPEPFVYTTKASKRIVFPDIFELPAEEAEAFLKDIETLEDSEVLEKWLSAKDLKNLKEDKLPFRRQKALVFKVLNYYMGITGDSGEGIASEKS